jgi:uncharacterized protein
MGHHSQSRQSPDLAQGQNRQPWVVCPEGVVVTVRLTPKGGRDAVDGIEHLADGSCVLKARVRAAASDGEANNALQHLLAQMLHVAPRDVALIGCATSRIKRLRISGESSSLLEALHRIGAIGAK